MQPAGATGSSAATDDENTKSAELAKKLSNPIANLISVPIQNNWDFGIGPANAMRYTANVQPVIPFSICKDWNVITRTILPIIYAESPVDGGNDKSGLGDTVQSFFFSPKEPTRSGRIWGAGPVFLWPTSTDDALGIGKVGAEKRVVKSERIVFLSVKQRLMLSTTPQETINTRNVHHISCRLLFECARSSFLKNSNH